MTAKLRKIVLNPVVAKLKIILVKERISLKEEKDDQRKENENFYNFLSLYYSFCNFLFIIFESKFFQ